MASSEQPILVLTGTTASGKNRVGAHVAMKLRGEIISLDSMKVYRGMDVGTDKPSADLMRSVPHHLVDILDPLDGMNLSRFVNLAHDAVKDIRARGYLPVAVGGTALYLTGFLRGVFDGPEADMDFRRGLRAEAAVLGVPALHARLMKVDPVAGGRIHPNDYKRLERALEVYALTGRPISELQGQWSRPPRVDYRLFILTWDRGVLDRRIEERVDRMFAGGFVDEVKRILDGGGFGRESSQALGYREVVAHLKGEITLAEAIEMVKRATRRFARRQLTWFRRMDDAHWIHAEEGQSVTDLASRVIDEYLVSLDR